MATGDSKNRHVLTGLVRLREHCTFAWEQLEDDPQRTAIVRETHCPRCVAALRELGYEARPESSTGA